ncbi:MAG: YncE family protein [Acidobacteriia bacterium]|nr:YncE family protein [Terriglobia bacterium]
MSKRYSLFVVLLFLALVGVAVTQPQAPAAGPYKYLKTIAVGAEGGWDYAATDEAGRRVYVTHGTKVVVIDIDKDEVISEITDTPGVHGFAIAPELGLGFSSNGQESKASIVDLKTLKTTSKVDTGQNPDGILYVPGVQEVYTFNRSRTAPSATVFEAKTGKVITTITLPGTPEFAVVDTKAGRIYNNIDNKNEVVAIDMKTHQIVAEWPTAPGEGGSGMAIDLVNHRLFIGCDNLMVMMDSTSGKVVGTVPIGAGVDANRFDPGTRLAFASCGQAGSVTIAREETPDKLTVVQTLETARGARTMTLDPKTHKIYLAAVDYQPAPATPPAGTPPGRGRAQAVPNSFKVLVYEMVGK